MPGRCKICRKPCAKLELDHDHKSGQARGYICSRCNRRVGILEKRYAGRLAEYMKGSGWISPDAMDAGMKKIGNTAQSRYQDKMVRRGCCRICGKRRYGNAYLCPYHAKKAAKYMKSWRAAKKATQTPEMPCTPSQNA